MKRMFSVGLVFFAGFAFSCATQSGNVSSVSLTDTRWVLVSINGKLVPEAGRELMREPFVVFQAGDKRLSGNGGVNNFFGSFQFDNDKLSIPPGIARTFMTGPGIEIEENFIQALGMINLYTIKERELILTKNGEIPVLLFRADSNGDTAKNSGVL